LKKQFGDEVEFIGVYVREAHPTDGWRMPSNDKDGVSFAQPTTYAERCKVAGECCGALKMSIPLVVDGIDDAVGHAYSGMPDRLYLIDRAGKVAYKGGRGPFGFKPAELGQAIAMLLLDEELSRAKKPDAGANGKQAHVRLPSAAAAWAKLPDVADGAKAGPLPNWAKAYAAALPRTTAATLELDYVQRVKSPLDPALRAKVRYAAAEASGSEYGKAYARFDLERAGGTPEPVNDAERVAVAFARKLTREAYQVTDAEFAEVRKRHGDANAVAIVLCVAYANFQDRLALTLGLPVEPGGPLPPIKVTFKKPHAGMADPPARSLPITAALPGRATVDDGEWTKIDIAELKKAMAAQQERAPRLPVPTFEEVMKAAPPGTYKPDRPLKILWSRTCVGYQPELTLAWFHAMRTFGDEAKQDRVFEETLFWVVTRSINCFY
jgi:alkylhydroperoxidase family enzyme